MGLEFNKFIKLAGDLRDLRELYSLGKILNPEITDFDGKVMVNEIFQNALFHHGEDPTLIIKPAHFLLVKNRIKPNELTGIKSIYETIPVGGTIKVDFSSPEDFISEGGRGLFLLSVLCNDYRIELIQRVHRTKDDILFSVILKYPHPHPNMIPKRPFD